jgi:hypothetical protein
VPTIILAYLVIYPIIINGEEEMNTGKQFVEYYLELFSRDEEVKVLKKIIENM